MSLWVLWAFRAPSVSDICKSDKVMFEEHGSHQAMGGDCHCVHLEVGLMIETQLNCFLVMCH